MTIIDTDRSNYMTALHRKEVFTCHASGLPVRSRLDTYRECRKGNGGVYVFSLHDNHCREFWPDRLITNGLCKFKMP